VEKPFKLPGIFLHQIPLLQSIRTYARLGLPVNLLMSLYVAANWEALITRLRISRRRTAAAIFAALGILEGWVAPLPLHPVRTPDVYKRILEEWEDGTVVEIPFGERDLPDLARAMYYQTFHGRPLVGGYLARNVPRFESLAQSSSLISSLRNPERAEFLYEKAQKEPGIMADERRQIVDLNLLFVVLHRDRFPEERADRIEDYLRDVLGAGLIASDGPRRLYRFRTTREGSLGDREETPGTPSRGAGMRPVAKNHL
jgi:hypothetical protein